MPTRVLDIDLAAGLEDRHDLAGYDRALILLRNHERPIGSVNVSCSNGIVRAADIIDAITSDQAFQARLKHDSVAAVVDAVNPPPADGHPTWSVVIPTKARTVELRACLESVLTAAPEGGEIIVVDSAPTDDRTASVVAEFPARYLREDLPGAHRARSLGARHASGEVVLFADDDVIVDPLWIRTLLKQFSSRRVGAATGLIFPLELETRSQEIFERHAGPSLRGFERRVFDAMSFAPARAGMMGSGANMAFRRDVIQDLKLFELDLGPDTPMGVSLPGEDTDALYRTVAAGYQVVYEPSALVWHRHKTDPDTLRRTMVSWHGTGAFAMFSRWTVEHHDMQAVRVGLREFRQHHLHELVRSMKREPDAFPLSLMLAEIAGSVRGPFAYLAARRDGRRSRRRKRRAAR
jgi:GT2 family glycosyltransferase